MFLRSEWRHSLVRLLNQATGKVADAANCGTADGTDVRLWTSLGTTCQEWSVQPV